MCSSAAIHFNGIVVSCGNRRAMATLTRPPRAAICVRPPETGHSEACPSGDPALRYFSIKSSTASVIRDQAGGNGRLGGRARNCLSAGWAAAAHRAFSKRPPFPEKPRRRENRLPESNDPAD